MKHVATIAFLGLTSQAESFSPKRRSLGPAFLRATPKRLEDNVDGVLYVNDRVRSESKSVTQIEKSQDLELESLSPLFISA